MFRVVFALAAVLTPGLAVAAPRIAFDRVIPAARDLGGADDIALTYAIGDNDDLETFLATLVDATSRSGMLRVTDARTALRPPRVDAHLRVTSFTCETTVREGEGNAYDIDGKRIRKSHRFSDAICTARIEIQRTGGDLRKHSFQVRGEGTSPRVDRVTMEEEGIALDQAARY